MRLILGSFLSFFLNAFATLSIAQINHGTCIAFCANKEFIFLAVDSQINHEDSSKTTGLKIHNLGTTTWVNTGLYRFSNLFDIDEIIMSHSNGVNNFAAQQVLIRQTVTNKLSSVIEMVFKLSPTLYKGDDIPILVTVIMNSDGENFKMEHVNYFCKKLPNGKLYIKASLIESNENIDGSLFNILGSNKSAKPVMDKLIAMDSPNDITTNWHVPTHLEFKFQNIAEILYYFVYLETMGNPSDVGEPISVVRIDKNGVTGLINYPIK
ncbi:hypothetical protein [Mucilaginibacter gilvus]|uniref:Uncharacterized protein n=1 Tax=Mucilaginibacter gilvus TaxID=2305909 RepID=A0A3S3UJK3_9SPHI|nr:hypothetical protein [Mucilaginibacter gilvus]RWY47858.1 hypothetical protein EPL05_19900 [Mucilaginibacter gilvus]